MATGPYWSTLNLHSMERTENDLRFIQFRKDFSYAKKTPTFVSNAIGGADEIARRVLDWNDVLYKDEPHAPLLCIPVINKLLGDGGAVHAAHRGGARMGEGGETCRGKVGP